MNDLQYWQTDSLIEYARNPRKNDQAVDRVAAAIREFGFRVPIVAKSDGTIVDGHLRLKAAKKLGMAEVPILLADDMTEAQIKAFRISVNKMAELAEWDNELLKLEFDDLAELGFDLELTGFDLSEIAVLNTEPDFMPGTEDDQGKLDQLDPKWCSCPHCGKEFDLREQN
jgi:ParB-like chromosome segregation protein Spo0J